MPFYRLEKLQEGFGVPLPSSTQWEILEETKKKIEPAYEELFRQAAQGSVIYNDDTTVRILELMGKRREKLHDPPERTGLYTTGIISEVEERKIALYFSANRHAGENLAKLLTLRDAWRGPPIQMSDGLKHNRLEGTDTIVSHCLAHGRRRKNNCIYEPHPAGQAPSGRGGEHCPQAAAWFPGASVWYPGPAG